MNNLVRDVLKDTSLNHEERAGILFIADTKEFKRAKKIVQRNLELFQDWDKPYILTFLIYCANPKNEHIKAMDRVRFKRKAKEAGIKLKG